MMYEGILFNNALEIIDNYIKECILDRDFIRYKLYSSESDSDIAYTKTFIFFYLDSDCFTVITFNYIRSAFFMTVSHEVYNDSNIVSYSLNGKQL